MENKLSKVFLKLLLFIGFSCYSTVSQSSAFSLIENSASGQGVAFAGAAAIGEDASTIYFNPAGMVRLPGQQIVVAGHVVLVDSTYTDSNSQIVVDAAGNTAPLSGKNSALNTTAFVPSLYYSAELDNDVFVGVGVTVPFGLSSQYEDGWYGRYHALNSEITSININPSIAWKATEKVSVGFGISIQYIELKFTNNIESNSACNNIAASFGLPLSSCAGITNDSHIKLEGDSTEVGYNAGVLIDLTEKDRIGIAYRSAIKHNVSGDEKYTLDPVLAGVAGSVSIPSSPFNILQNTSLDAIAELPETFSVSYVREISVNWTILADWTWTGWSSLDVVAIVQADGVPGQEPSLDFAYANTNRYSVGMHYKPDNQWVYRGGLAFDETPVRSKEQTSARVPDNERIWLSVGIGYAPSSDWKLDLGFSHLLIDNIKINNGPSRESSGAILTGEYESTANILSAQANFNF